jgi:predicted nucleic acid-binding protein
MNAYFDSSLIVKLYIREPGSKEVAVLAAKSGTVPFSPLHELEIRNAIRAGQGRHILTPPEAAAALAALDDDIANGRLERIQPDWQAVFSESERLSAAFTRHLLVRTLDILHVAAALVMNYPSFVTGDRCQLKLARRAGLKARCI